MPGLLDVTCSIIEGTNFGWLVLPHSRNSLRYVGLGSRRLSWSRRRKLLHFLGTIKNPCVWWPRWVIRVCTRLPGSGSADHAFVVVSIGLNRVSKFENGFVTR